MDQLEQILDSAEFETARGWNGKRAKMCRNGIPRIIFFANWRIQKSRGLKKYPAIFELLKQIASEHFPQHEYNVIQINKNVECAAHRDTANVGNSIIFTLGNFTGGKLKIEDFMYDIYKSPKLFNGYESTHETEPFEGTRYAVIYYKTNLARDLD